MNTATPSDNQRDLAPENSANLKRYLMQLAMIVVVSAASGWIAGRQAMTKNLKSRLIATNVEELREQLEVLRDRAVEEVAQLRVLKETLEKSELNDVTVSGDLTVMGVTTLNSNAYAAGNIETNTLTVGQGGTAISMKSDEIKLGYGGENREGGRKDAIVLRLGNTANDLGEILCRPYNDSDLIKLDVK